MYKVLIVEDEELICKGLRYNYEWNKLDCVVIGEENNGKDGLRAIKEMRPDIVITDIRMPIMSGLEMIQEASEEYDFSSIIISGYDEFELAKKAIQLGVCEYLIKPLDYDQLDLALQRAQTWLEARRNYERNKSKQGNILDIELINKNLADMENIHSRRVKKMLAFVEENYNKKIGMSDLVELLDTSGTYLNQKFKLETGLTFNDYLNRYRIQKSIQLMKEGNQKISCIAVEVGFRDYKYFIDVFKKYIGMSPGKFMEYIGSQV